MKESDGERQSFPEISEDDFLIPNGDFLETVDMMLDGTPVPSDEDIFADFLDMLEAQKP